MSPHGSQDWANRAKAEVVFGVQDLGELAARLGSIATFHRGGKIVWIDSFEDGIEKWLFVSDGSGAAAEWTTDDPWMGAACLRLLPAEEADRYIEASHYCPVPVLGKMGLELALSFNDRVKYVEVRHLIYDGSVQHTAGVRHPVGTATLQYLDEDLNWVTFASGVDLFATVGAYHIMKLIVDFSTGKYKSCFVNNQSWNLTAYPYRKVTSSVSPYSLQRITIINGYPLVATTLVDDVIITQEEP